MILQCLKLCASYPWSVFFPFTLRTDSLHVPPVSDKCPCFVTLLRLGSVGYCLIPNHTVSPLFLILISGSNISLLLRVLPAQSKSLPLPCAFGTWVTATLLNTVTFEIQSMLKFKFIEKWQRNEFFRKLNLLNVKIFYWKVMFPNIIDVIIPFTLLNVVSRQVDSTAFY